MGQLPSSDTYDSVYVQSLKHINIEQLHTCNQPPRGFHVSFIKKTAKPWCRPPLSIGVHPSWAPAVASDIWAPQTTLHLLMRFKCIELCYQVSTSEDGRLVVSGDPHPTPKLSWRCWKVFLTIVEMTCIVKYTKNGSKHVKTLHLKRVRHFAKSPST